MPGHELNGDLCVPCADTNFERLSRLNYSVSGFVRHLGSLESLASSPCRLCRFYATLAPRNAPQGETYDSYDLRVFNVNWVFTGESRESARRNVIGVAPSLWGSKSVQGLKEWARLSLAMEETGYLSLDSPTMDIPLISKVKRVNSKSFDVDMVTGWMGYCQDHHPTRCFDHDADDPPGLHVFDCHRRQVVPAPANCRYVSLSYVWGATVPKPSQRWSTRGRFEKVIEDSIAVTLMLNMRYLWVDRLCIDQADKKKQRHQINQMDLIYARSALTIIAAAGYGPDRGLPGVNGTFRSPQKQITLPDGTTLISTLPAGRRLVQDSKWNTRGWTYQEGILSTKRLIFTDCQVLFECNGMHCCEAVSFDLDRIHSKGTEMFDMDAYRLGAFGAKTPGLNPREYMKYVSDFSKRQLTFPGDTLDAIQGVLSTFTRGSNPVHNFWGIPIFSGDTSFYEWQARRPAIPTLRWQQVGFVKLQSPTSRSRSTRFMISLLWEPRPSYPRGFTRKKGFPSWSWTGWEGQVREHAAVGNVLNQGMFLDASVSFLEKHANYSEGEVRSIEGLPLQPGKHVLHEIFSPFLFLETNVLPVEIVEINFSEEERDSFRKSGIAHGDPTNDVFFVRIDTRCAAGVVYCLLESYDRQRTQFSTDPNAYMAIHSFTDEVTHVDRAIRSSKAMVVERVGGHYERVGLFSLDCVLSWHENGSLQRPSFVSFKRISAREKVWLG